MSALALEIRALKRRVEDLAEGLRFTAQITTLAPERLRLRRDIPVIIQSTGDDFIATFYDAGISATGDNDQEAVANLKDILIQKYRILGRIPAAKLGKAPRQQLAVLKAFIRKGG